MSVLVVGLSHRSAPVEVLERVALSRGEATKLRAAALDVPAVSEAVVLATCNRVEIYTQVDRFHGPLEALSRLLAERAGVAHSAGVLGSLDVHYDAAVVAHLFSVAAGLESMVLGEPQILGQVREAMRDAQQEHAVGPGLNALFQQALRVGKRVHSDTGIDNAGRSVVSVAFERARAALGDLTGRRVCVVGAGSVAALVATAAQRADAGSITICSRTPASTDRLAASIGGRAGAWADLAAEIADADLVVSCTGATAIVLSDDIVTAALTRRESGRTLAIIDLALPHDVDPVVADRPDVQLVTLPDLATSVTDASVAGDLRRANEIVEHEVESFLVARREDAAAPTVVALRTMAAEVVSAELTRLWRRLPHLEPADRDEIARTLRRATDKVLHEPTVRVKRLADRVPESTYAAALAELFALDPDEVDAVSRPVERP